MDPKTRRAVAGTLTIAFIIMWGSTHLLLAVTKPEGASSWVFHMLLAQSWAALVLTMYEIFETTNVRTEQDDNE